MKFYIDTTDKRNQYLLKKLNEKGKQAIVYTTSVKGIEKGDIIVFSPAKKLEEKDILYFNKGVTIVGGNQSEIVSKVLQKKGIKYINLLKDEAFAIKNAILTAEGVLYNIISCTDKSIFNNKIAVLGAGRVGKAICQFLNKLNLKINLFLFQKDDFDNAIYFCDKVKSATNLKEDIKDFDIIINTVPFEILTEEILKNISDEAVVLEIASKSCLDKNKLYLYNFHYIEAPALPQKFCAETASEIMLESIFKMGE